MFHSKNVTKKEKKSNNSDGIATKESLLKQKETVSLERDSEVCFLISVKSLLVITY